MRDHGKHDLQTGAVTEPPIDDWERQGALRELTRVARTSSARTPTPSSGASGASRGASAAVAEAMERILELGAKPAEAVAPAEAGQASGAPARKAPAFGRARFLAMRTDPALPPSAWREPVSRCAPGRVAGDRMRIEAGDG